MSRLPRQSLDTMTPERRQVFDEIVANRPVKPVDGHIGGPFDVWLQSPEMGHRLVGLGGFFRFRTSVDRRYIELAILVTGAHFKAQFEWWAHEPMAREAGVPEEVIAAIKVGERPIMNDPADIAAYDVAHSLHTQKRLSDETFAAAHAQFGDQGIAELIGLCGFYALVSMTLNGFDVELPSGATNPF